MDKLIAFLFIATSALYVSCSKDSFDIDGIWLDMGSKDTYYKFSNGNGYTSKHKTFAGVSTGWTYQVNGNQLQKTTTIPYSKYKMLEFYDIQAKGDDEVFLKSTHVDTVGTWDWQPNDLHLVKVEN